MSYHTNWWNTPVIGGDALTHFLSNSTPGSCIFLSYDDGNGTNQTFLKSAWIKDSPDTTHSRKKVFFLEVKKFSSSFFNLSFIKIYFLPTGIDFKRENKNLIWNLELEMVADFAIRATTFQMYFKHHWVYWIWLKVPFLKETCLGFWISLGNLFIPL